MPSTTESSYCQNPTLPQLNSTQFKATQNNRVTKDFFAPVSGFSTKKCRNLVCAEFCQAQPQLKSTRTKTDLILFSDNTATQPPNHSMQQDLKYFN